MVLMADRSETAATNFNTIKISIASPQQILNWSHGEVTKPETINYRTLRPEKDGLFCERLFGPTKDWECFCGKYKRIRYKGVVCDRCGVEVTRAKVRRERMCHIRLAAPVAHIWFSKTTPSRIGLLLDLTPRNLERVLYFAQHIIISIDKNARETALDAEQIRYELAIETLRREMEERIAAVPVDHAIPEHAALLVADGAVVQAGDALALIDEEEHAIPEHADTDTLAAEGEEVQPGDTLALALNNEDHPIPEHAIILVDHGAEVQPGDALAQIPGEEHAIPEHASILVDDGEVVQPGDALAQIPVDVPTQITATIAGKVELLGEGAGRRIRVVDEAAKITANIAGAVELLVEGDERGIRVVGEPTRVTANLAGVVELPGDGRIRVLQVTPAAIDGRVELLGEGAGRMVRVIGDAGTVIPASGPATIVDPVTGEILESVGAEREEQRKQALRDEYDQRAEAREVEYRATADELESLRPLQLLSESRCRELRDKYPDVFEAGMGAESIQEILKAVDLEALRAQLQDEMLKTSGQRLKKAIKRLRIVESFRNSGNRVQDMILEVMPVLPPELRPMVQLDGGRFATSDLNDLYRRVINRNNRLKRLLNLGAPEIIIRNEKRMLQEAVDALIDNGRRGRPIQGSHNHKLKSLSDLLRGKQGRFRQNLLGKRVDYSGRSVIVIGPGLKLHECGLPREMALELFKPFVMHRLVILGIAPNIRNAKRMVERARGEVWDILEDVIKDRPVLLNRAPTLHRLGIQAFMPKLIDGKAIQVHPLVCTAFNSDFDGDQMAVHVPLSKMAALEAKEMMLSTNNMLSPASGNPLVAPNLDMVMSAYYMTELWPDAPGAWMHFNNLDEARIAHHSGIIDMHAPIAVREVAKLRSEGKVKKLLIDGKECYSDIAGDPLGITTFGRLLFNDHLPKEDGIPFVKIPFINKKLRRRDLEELVSEMFDKLGNEETAETLDDIKSLGFFTATISGITESANEGEVPKEKDDIVAKAKAEVIGLEEQFAFGFISDAEKHDKTVEIWQRATSEVASLIQRDLPHFGGLAYMALSGAKGNITQINQMYGMKGLVMSPKGGILERPITSSFREGFSPHDYFLSSHAARKGLTDTALNTASSGYMTRRLIDVAQEIMVQGEDCGTIDGWVPREPDPSSGTNLQNRIVGRLAATAISHPETREVLVERNQRIDRELANVLVDAGIRQIPVRSPLTCESPRNICRSCYGDLPATRQPVKEGQAVGIIAAQSIGEPGTQLTMRTFHVGGVRVARDPRYEMLVEIARLTGVTAGDLRFNPDQVQNDLQAVLSVVTHAWQNTSEPANVLAQAIPSLLSLTSREEVKDEDGEIQEVLVDFSLRARLFLLLLLSAPKDFEYQEDEEEKPITALGVLRGALSGTPAVNPTHIPVSYAPNDWFAKQLAEKLTKELLALCAAAALVDGAEELIRLVLETSRFAQHGEAERYRDELNFEGQRIREGVERRNLDITGGLPQVEHVFEARIPKDAAILSEIDGQVEIAEGEEWERVRVVHRTEVQEDYPLPPNGRLLVSPGEEIEQGMALAEVMEIPATQREEYALPEGASLLVDDGEEIAPEMLLATAPSETDGTVNITATINGWVEIGGGVISVVGTPPETIVTPVVTAEITANLSGRVEIGDGVITIIGEDVETRDYIIPNGAQIRVFNGDTVIAGTPLTVGPQNPHDLLNIRGQDAVQSHLVELVQAVYQSQGVAIHDKHIELILRQMLRRVEVEEGGGTSLIPGDRIDKFLFQQLNEQALAEGRPPASARPVLMGVTRASLQTDSFLSRASFQETTRVLTEAAVSGSQDYLQGLKENVIIGRLIPAQVEIPGMEELLRPQPALDLRGAAGWLSGDLDVPLNPLEEGDGRPEFADPGELAAAARAFAREPEEEAEAEEEFPEDDDDDEVDPLAEAPALEAAEDDEAVLAEAPQLVETMEQEPDDAALALAEEESSNDEAEA